MESNSKPGYKLREATWKADRKELMEVRTSVFIEEQMVPVKDEIDEFDPVSYHVLITDENDKPVGTGRLNPEGQIGRMAVLKEHRGNGIGDMMMRHFMKKALNEGRTIIEMSAQTHAIPFYSKYGFTTVGRVYDEVGIPHQKMVYIRKDKK
ncbi:MAG: GNAT family N-acetyltransferase [Balneolia bacterium]|nr:GNAT family N-acetyltransferase [Balneolia bacterium]